MTAKIKKILLAVAALAALALGGAALADATSSGNESATQEQGDSSDRGDQGEGGLPADVAARARAAAAQATGGEPGSTERDGESGATYEVEVTRPDGSQADVRLDEQFNVVVVEGDSEN